jgi:hypothetical protein
MPKERLVITSKFHESVSNGIGTAYRYKVDNEYQTSGAFNISLLPIYEGKYNIDWKASYLKEVKTIKHG